MGKSGWVGKLICVLVILSSISICFLGMQSNTKQEQKRKVEYAKSTVENEAVKINQLNKAIGQLYQKNQDEFLIEPFDDEKLKDIERDATALKTEAADFGLKKTDFKTDTSEISQGKNNLLGEIETIKNKKNTQEEVAALLEQAPTDWETGSSSVSVNEKATAEGILQIRNKMNKTESQWSNSIIAYLDEMAAQVKQYHEIKQSIAEMLKDDVLTETATLDNFILVFNQVDQVKSEILKKELSSKLDIIDKLLETEANNDTISE